MLHSLSEIDLYTREMYPCRENGVLLHLVDNVLTFCLVEKLGYVHIVKSLYFSLLQYLFYSYYLLDYLYYSFYYSLIFFILI